MQQTKRIRSNGSAQAVARRSTSQRRPQAAAPISGAGDRLSRSDRAVLRSVGQAQGRLGASELSELARLCEESAAEYRHAVRILDFNPRGWDQIGWPARGAVPQVRSTGSPTGAGPGSVPTTGATSQNDHTDGDSAAAVVENWRPRLVGLSDDLSNAHDMCHALLVLLENLAVHPPEGSGWGERIVNGFALLYIEAQKQIGEAEKSIEDFIDELRATAPLKTTVTPAGAIRGAQ